MIGRQALHKGATAEILVALCRQVHLMAALRRARR